MTLNVSADMARIRQLSRGFRKHMLVGSLSQGTQNWHMTAYQTAPVSDDLTHEIYACCSLPLTYDTTEPMIVIVCV